MRVKNIINCLLFSCLCFLFPVQSSYSQSATKGMNYVDLTVAAEKSVNAVVYIKTEFTQKNSVWDDFFGGNKYVFAVT